MTFGARWERIPPLHFRCGPSRALIASEPADPVGCSHPSRGLRAVAQAPPPSSGARAPARSMGSIVSMPPAARSPRPRCCAAMPRACLLRPTRTSRTRTAAPTVRCSRRGRSCRSCARTWRRRRRSPAAADVASIGARTASSSASLLKGSPSDGPARLALLAKLEKISARADRALSRINLGPDFFLVGPLGDARQRFADRLASLHSAVKGADAMATGMQRLLQGPRRYLVLVANNAEMRGSGMFLSAGVATFADGAFTVGDFQPTPTFNLPAGAVAVPPDLQSSGASCTQPRSGATWRARRASMCRPRSRRRCGRPRPAKTSTGCSRSIR